MPAIISVDYDALLPFASDSQREAVEALAAHGTQRRAAKALGINPRTLERKLRGLRAKAARQGHSPEHDAAGLAPPGYHLKGKSTYFDADGRVAAQWVKTQVDREAANEAVREAIAAFCEDAKPVKVQKGPRRYDTDIIPWYQIGDAHLGLLAHDAEVGANFDLKIAEAELCEAFALFFEESESCERCVINDLGDATHYENMAGVTEGSGHPLDTDGRFPKVIHVYSRIMRTIVDQALRKYKHVDVIINQGNHSRTNDFWMAELLRATYKTDRLTVLNNHSVFIPYRMGNTFVLVHHGDKTRPADIAKVMAHDFRQDWGETEYHYVDMGHLHHKISATEFTGCTVEIWNTLAGKDKWAHDNGYRGAQSITRVDRSRQYGEVGRRVLPVKEIRDRLWENSTYDGYTPPERRTVHTV